MKAPFSNFAFKKIQYPLVVGFFGESHDLDVKSEKFNIDEALRDHHPIACDAFVPNGDLDDSERLALSVLVPYPRQHS